MCFVASANEVIEISGEDYAMRFEFLACADLDAINLNSDVYDSYQEMKVFRYIHVYVYGSSSEEEKHRPSICELEIDALIVILIP